MWPFLKKNQKIKVFCEECKFITNKNVFVGREEHEIDGCLDSNFSYYCKHPFLVLKDIHEDSFLSRGTGEVLSIRYQPCVKLNKNNSCQKFVPKDKTNGN